MDSKICTKCNQDKPLSEFRKQSNTKDGLKYVCIPCDNKTQKDRYVKIKGKKSELKSPTALPKNPGDVTS